MKMRAKSLSWVLAGVVCCALGSRAGATLIAYEGFDYAAGSSLAGQNGGTGWAGPYLSGVSNTVAAPGLTYTDANGKQLQVTGNTLTYYDPSNHYDYDTRAIANSASISTAGNSVWFSFIGQDYIASDQEAIQFDTGNSVAPNFTDLYVGKYNGSTHWAAALYQGGSATVDYGYDAYPSPDIGAQTFAVGRIDFGSATDNIRIWFNPLLGGAAPSDAVANLNLLNVPHLALTNVTLQGGFSQAQPAYYDEIRLGTTFADVTPVATPEPASIGLAAAGALTLLVRRRGR
jgi:hypothetical protein